MPISKRVFLPLVLTLVAALLFSACHRGTTTPPELVVPMRNFYAISLKLFSYAWDTDPKPDAKENAEVVGLLNDLIGNSHKVEQVSKERANEPGFKIALETNDGMLVDVRNRLEAGAIDYAKWKLKGAAGNCVACHSRFESERDFHGELPSSTNNSFSEKLAAGEFLVATRQFEKAGKYLYELALKAADDRDANQQIMDPLALWLVVEVRVKYRPEESAHELRKFIADSRLTIEERSIIGSWIRELNSLNPVAEEDNSKAIPRARDLLAAVLGEDSILNDQRNLVNTLRASALLHTYLDAKDPALPRAEALLLLSQSYIHIPITSFEVYPDLYLEQCIREFPGSAEAKKAYELIKSRVELQSSGSGGIHIDKEDSAHLLSLRKLAYGK